MTFESMIENTPVAPSSTDNVKENPIVNEETLAVKVSYGDDIRRATFNGTTYVALRDLSAKLFELDPATTVLKYQDEEGDNITVSSDGEMLDALQVAKGKKILRLFVDIKAPSAPQVATEDQRAASDAFPCGRRVFGGPIPMRGGFNHRGGPFMHGFPRGGHHAFPHHAFPHSGGQNAFQHPHPHPHPHPHGDFPHPGGQYRFPGHFAAPTEQVYQQPAQSGGPAANYYTPHVFAHGVFSSADAVPSGPCNNSPYARCPPKEHKKAMKEQIRAMKANAITDEDLKAIKDLKQQMRAECKAKWHEIKSEKKAHKSGWKADKKAKKAEWKQDKKCEKGDRLVARHVADVTIPDNSELPADTPVTKTWRMRNAGLQAWPADSQLLFVSRRGDNLNGPERVPVGTVEPQQEVDVSVTFITPSEPGRYIGYYRMASADGSKFGQRVWVSFIIPSPNNAAPKPLVDVSMPMDEPSAPALYSFVAHADSPVATVSSRLHPTPSLPFPSEPADEVMKMD